MKGKDSGVLSSMYFQEVSNVWSTASSLVQLRLKTPGQYEMFEASSVDSSHSLCSVMCSDQGFMVEKRGTRLQMGEDT